MPAKGVAISQIILLVLGIIVLAVVAFLLYSNFSTTTGQVDFQKCRAAATNACASCSIASGGSTLNCAGVDYLKTATDKLCAKQGLISGTSADDVLVNGKVTDYTVKGTITCSQYIGGTTGSSSGSQNPSGGVCTSGATQSCTITGGGTGTQTCQSDGTWGTCSK